MDARRHRPCLRRTPLLVLLAGAWSSSCSSPAATPDGGACSWPAELAQTDSSSGQCRNAARAALHCTNAGGASVSCVTNSAQCDTSGSVTGPLTCENQCRPTEFGLICGYVGPGPQVTPPPNCRALPPFPSGEIWYCCPCGT